MNFKKVIYNAVDFNRFEMQDEKEDYMIFLSRLVPYKGVDIAIRVAMLSGRPLKIAGKIDTRFDRYFRESVEPYFGEATNIEYMGEVTDLQKKELLRRASCLIYPITWDEPFGIVMIEAMASGTPVIAMSMGSVPEVVVHGKTGYIVSNEAEMVEAVRHLDSISPSMVRKTAKQKFSIKPMVDNYLKAYEKILEN